MPLFNTTRTWSPLPYLGNRKWIKELIYVLCVFIAAINAFGTDIQVTNANTSGAGSFDQAMQDFIAAGTSGTISFAPSLSGSTITITTAYSMSANSLMLDGDVNGDGVSDITLQSDGANHRFFSLSGTAELTFKYLQVENFSTTSDGGVVQISTGIVTIENCLVRNNTARSGGVIHIENGFGTGDANISKSIFSENSATSFGGVIYQASFLSSIHTVIENSLFYENSAPNSNGGVAYISDGANFTLRHVTLSNNSSKFSGGAISNNSNLTIENSLIVGNTSESGSGNNIQNNRTFNNVEGSSIVGGEDGASDDVSDYFVDAANGDYSLFTTSSAVSAGLNSLATAAGITTDVVGNAVPYDGIVDIVDAGAYEFQGDPPINFESSSVINSSSLAVTLTFDREVSGLDMTDFSSQTGDLSFSSLTTSDNIEYTATFTLSDLTEKVIDTVYMDALVEDLFTNNLQAKDTFAFVYYVPVAQVTNTQTSGEGSLDQALQDFIDSEGTVNTVEFDPSLSGSTIMVTKEYSFSQGTLLIDGDIDDDGTIDVTLQSNGTSHRFFDVAGSTSLTLNHLRLRDFTTSNLWGGIVIVNSGAASIDVQGCEMLNSHSGRNGGAIYCEAGNVIIQQSIFDGNSGDWGGAVTIYGGTTAIENSVFSDNNASLGGAIYGRNGANINVRHCTFSGNTGTANGGAIYNLNQLTVENSLFVDNIVNSTVSNIRNDANFTDNGGNIYGGESGASNDPNDYFTDASNNDYTLNGRSLAADQGDNSLATNAGITTDLLGNPRPYVGTAQTVDAGAYELQADPDLVAPSVSITTTSGNPTSDNPIPVTITFSESVTGFESTDLVVSGGTIDNFLGTGDSYSFNLIPDADGTLTVDVAADVAVDAVGNGNTAATQFSIVYDGPITWSGSSWSNGSGPASDGTDDIIIDGNYSYGANGALNVDDLTINSGAIVEVNTEEALTVANALVNNGALSIMSGASLMVFESGSITGNDITFKRNTRYADGRYSFVGSPVEADASIVGSDLGSYVFKYNEATPYGSDDGLARWEDASSDELVPGKGYTQAFQQEIVFVGMPNQGTISIDGTYTEDVSDDYEGWMLVSNPYPAPIDVADFLSANSNISGAIYIWDDNGSDTQRGTNADYIVANGTMATNTTPAGGQTRYDQTMGSMQGFFVKLSGAADTEVEFNESMRVTGNSDDHFFRETIMPIARINLTDEQGLFKQTVIGLTEEATTAALNRTYDAQAFSAAADYGVYTIKAGRSLALNGMPEAWEALQLQVNVAAAGSYTLGVELEDFSGALFLRDNQTGAVIDLRKTSYAFHAEGGIHTDRFELLASNEPVLGIANQEVLIYAYDDVLHINQADQEPRFYQVFNLKGQRVLTKEVSSNTEIDVSRLAKGVYLVFDGSRTHKILLK